MTATLARQLQGYTEIVSWPWIVLLGLAVAVVIGAEWSRVGKFVGVDARRQRERSKRKASLKLIRSEEEEFAASVERDLAGLPTIEEKDRRR
jgi:hypothetical protein